MSEDLGKVEIIKTVSGMIPNEKEFESMGIPEMWKKTKGIGVKVAVIDTGIDTEHPEFKYSFKSGMNMLNQTLDVRDDSGHGSAVAGLIAGRKTGVAPNAELYIAKVLDSNGNGSTANVLDGITFAINHGVDILCISLGSEYNIPLILRERIIQAYNEGITIVCATGNSGRNSVNYPASMDEIIAVGGVNEKYKVAWFSNYGAETDVVAPSVNILSAYKDNNYARMTGTSFSAPLVAGAIALLISYYRKKGIKLTPGKIREEIEYLGVHSYEYGHGLMDLRKLMKWF